MDNYKKIPFDDPDLCVPDLDDFDATCHRMI